MGKFDARYVEYAEQGRWDFGHAGDVGQFEDEIAQGGELDEIMARIKEMLTDAYKDEWIKQQGTFERGIEPDEAWRNWLYGWADAARDEVAGHVQKKLDTHEVWYLAIPEPDAVDEADEEIVETFDDVDEALSVLASIPVGRLLEGDGNGPNYRFAWTDAGDDGLNVDQFALVTSTQRKEFKRARAEARARGWRKNPYEVRSKSGHEQTFAREEDAEFEADELRRAGARDVEVRKRTRGTPAAAYRRANPTGMIVYTHDGSPDRTVIDELEVARDAFEAHQDQYGNDIINGLVKEYGVRVARCIRRLRDTIAAKKHPRQCQQYLYKIYGKGIQGAKYFFGDEVDDEEHHLVIVSSSTLVERRGEIAIFAYRDEEPDKFDSGFPLRQSGYYGTNPMELFQELGIQYVIKCTEGKATTRRNPNMSREEAAMKFYELIADNDPSGMEIAQDLALEYNISLVELSKHQYLSKRGDPSKSLGEKSRLMFDPNVVLGRGGFWLAHSFTTYEAHPAKNVVWYVDYQRRVMISWEWQAPGAYGPRVVDTYSAGTFRTYLEAERTAAADAWAVAKFLKNQPPNTDIGDLEDSVRKILLGGDEELTKRGVSAPPAELYEKRTTKQKRTYAEAQDAAFNELGRAGWALRTNLKIPHATSPNGLLRLWFRPQAVYITLLRSAGSEHHAFKHARSISYGIGTNGLPDMRSMSGSEFLAKITSMYPKTLGVPRQ